MWVWLFPNHKYQKILSSRRVIFLVFGMNDLEKPILKFRISQYSHYRKLQNRVLSLNKVLVKVMFTVYKVVSKNHVHTLRRFDDFFLYQKDHQVIENCENDFFSPSYCMTSFNLQRKLLYIFATIVVFYNDFGCLLQQKSITKTR